MFCSRHSLSKIVGNNRVASVCGANLRQDRGRTSGVGRLAVRVDKKGVDCAKGDCRLNVANICCYFGESCRPRLGSCSGCGLRNHSFCGLNVSCGCHFRHFSVRKRTTLKVDNVTFVGRILCSPLRSVQLVLIRHCCSRSC